jgi:hypothetical protein
MPHVIVVEHMHYAEAFDGFYVDGVDRRRSEQMVLGSGETFARALDQAADGFATPAYMLEDGARPGRDLDARNTVRHCVIPLPPSWHGRPPAWRRPGASLHGTTPDELTQSLHEHWRSMMGPIHEQTLATYRRAAEWSRPAGVVCILVGHGGPFYPAIGGTAEMTADVAPVQAARIHTSDVEFIREQLQGRDAHQVDVSGWTASQRLVHQMGLTFREHRVRRVDFMTCSVGMTYLGQHFLELLHAVWGRPVRGLVGDFAPGGDGHGFDWMVYGRVAAPEPAPDGVNVTGRSSGLWTMQSTEDPIATSERHEPADFPGYVPDRLFRSSSGRLLR